jgi:hypothetical protein
MIQLEVVFKWSAGVGLLGLLGHRGGQILSELQPIPQDQFTHCERKKMGFAKCVAGDIEAEGIGREQEWSAPNLAKQVQSSWGGLRSCWEEVHLCQPNFLGLKPKINVPVSLV